MYVTRALRFVPVVATVVFLTGCGESPKSVPTTPTTPTATGCSSGITVSTSEILARLAGGPGEFTVTAAQSCSWTATSSADWIRIREGAQRLGSGRVVYEVDPGDSVFYPVDFLRQAPIEIRSPGPTPGQDVWVRQFPDCTTVFVDADASPRGYVTQVTIDARGGRKHLFVLVESPFTCPWTALPATDSWLTTSGVPIAPQWRRGDADLVLTISPNPSTSSRSTVLLVGERPLTITQSGRQ